MFYVLYVRGCAVLVRYVRRSSSLSLSFWSDLLYEHSRKHRYRCRHSLSSGRLRPRRKTRIAKMQFKSSVAEVW